MYQVYVIQAGDTFGKIAALLLGSSARWKEIWNLNPQIQNPNLLKIGWYIYVPDAAVVPAANQALESSAKGLYSNQPKVFVASTPATASDDTDAEEGATEDNGIDLVSVAQNPKVLIGAGILGAAVILYMTRAQKYA